MDETLQDIWPQFFFHMKNIFTYLQANFIVTVCAGGIWKGVYFAAPNSIKATHLIN